MTESFESGEMPSEWSAGPGSSIKITEERFKAGSRSLRWDWKSGGTLICKAPQKFAGAANNKSFAFWVYNETAGAGRLTLTFLSNGKKAGECWFFLNFKGWHVLAAPYSQTGWKRGEKIDALRLSALGLPGKSGAFYIDWVNFEAGLPPGPDAQAPWINKPELLKTPEACAFSERDFSAGRPWLPPLVPAEQILSEQKADMDNLTPKQTKFAASGKQAKLSENKVGAIENSLKKWGITVNNGIVTGAPIANAFNSPPAAIPLKEFMAVINSAAASLSEARKSGDIDAERRLSAMTLLLFKFLVDQGYARQSPSYSMGGEYFNKDLRLLPSTVAEMREILIENNILDELVLAMFYHSSGNGALYNSDEPDGNISMIVNYYSGIVPMAGLINDPSLKIQCFQIISRRISRICCRLNCSPFGADGTSFQHGMHHWDYSSYELNYLLAIIERLNKTSFRCEPGVYDIFKKWVFTMAWSSCKYTMPPNLPGRPGNTRDINMAGYAGRLAEYGSPDGKEPVDKDLASLVVALAPNSDYGKKCSALGIAPYKFDGHRTINGAAAALHRRDDWLMAVTGINKNFPGVEIYGSHDEHYSSFSKNGSIFIVSSGAPVNCRASGWSFEGWDSRHYPGATNVLFSPQALWAGYKGVHNESFFAGGTDLDGDGVWGYEHRNQNMSFNKSAFFFGNRVTLITTDIKHSGNGGGAFVTTLFQNAFAGKPEHEPCFIDGSETKDFPFEKSMSVSAPLWLLDNKGSGYYIHPCAAELKILRHRQTWTYMTDKYLLDPQNNPFVKTGPVGNGSFKEKPLQENEKYYKQTENNFVLAYFEHGEKPDEQGCAYSILVRSNPAEMSEFSKEMESPASAPYKILRRDSRAHILWDKATNCTGYILFEEGKIDDSGLLLKVSRPCMAMLKPDGGKLKISVASTDLKKQTPLTLLLKGEYAIETKDTEQACEVTCSKGETRLEISYMFKKNSESYMPIRIGLTNIVNQK